MNNSFVDISAVPQCQIGDRVTFMGKWEKGERLLKHCLGKNLSAYEFLTQIRCQKKINKGSEYQKKFACYIVGVEKNLKIMFKK